MTSGEFDEEDAPGFASIVLGAIGLTDIGTISVYGYSLSDTAFSLGSQTISWAALLIISGAVWISITNEVELGDWIGMVSDGDDPQNKSKNLETAYRVAAAGLIAIPLLMVFIPGFNSFVTGSDIAGTAAAITMVAGAGVAAYGG
ncbi:hypothetical protein [Haloarchaeobius sp. DYHT-AS-18]|uniref:hypothetical protein n=1 Tax=Haloarchaeobius sp. DYHT-AS-18 TaxID=3446117 RepID=UPI003EB7A35B